MDLGISGRRALVTGSSSGIGAAIARMLAAEGCAVIVHGRNRKRTEAVADEIGAAGIAVGDLSRDEDADAVAAAAGEVDILVNNAGGTEASKPWFETNEADWLATFQANTVAAVRLIKRLVPGMRVRGWGRIIQIASAAASQPVPFGPDYCAAKSALVNLSVGLAKELAGTGVTVNSVSPGIVRTPAVERWANQVNAAYGWGERDFAAIERRLASEVVLVPVGRIGRTDEIAHAVCLLAAENGGYITGANIRVDGGQNQGVN